MAASRRWLGLSLAASCLVVAAVAGVAAGTDPDPSDLVGVWEVDLRPTPDAEPYLQEFIVTSVEQDSFRGTFYGTPIEEGRLNGDWGALRFAFVTTDGSGPYNHAGVLRTGRLEGTTHSLGRDFLSYWTAVRK